MKTVVLLERFCNRKKYKGVITVYLTLSFMIIISLVLAVIASTREKALRMRSEIAMDIGMQSIFAEYNRKLLEEYDLYFIDSSYGTKKGGPVYTGEHLEEYLDKNLDVSGDLFVPFSKNLFGLKADNVGIDVWSLATDSGAEVYKRQAIQYTKDKYGISIAEKLLNNKSEYKSSGIPDYDVDEERSKVREELKAADNAKDEEGNHISFDDPTKKIEKERSKIVDFFVNGSKTSDKYIEPGEVATGRRLEEGSGIIENTENLNSLTNNLLFDAYLLDKFSCYTKSVGHDGLEYELEYIFKGKESDQENLRQTIVSLLLLRETANCIMGFQNAGMLSQAEAIADAISLLLLLPELREPIKNAIIFSWTFAEACVDVNALLNGGKVPLIKGENDWKLKTWPQALAFKSYMSGKTSGSGRGLSYKEYLGLFISLENSSDKVMRSIDMIENDLRKMAGNKYFNMDNCIEFAEASADIRSIYGYEYEIRRYFGYTAMPKLKV